MHVGPWIDATKPPTPTPPHRRRLNSHQGVLLVWSAAEIRCAAGTGGGTAETGATGAGAVSVVVGAVPISAPVVTPTTTGGSGAPLLGCMSVYHRPVVGIGRGGLNSSTSYKVSFISVPTR